ncbi:unnamed protein product [Clonostachys solani]|uniref:Uncharacterized protein n=1 Tax=Clonostachys solani TaxID=160281 RepID=A0A9N9VXV7_9HYPO|nr:unnamed protein product [Clonostachys solani]
MLRLHPTTLTITSAELRDLDRRYPQRNRLRNSPKQDAHTRCTDASPPTADDDESTDVNDIPTPASSTPSQVADEDAALFVAPVQSDSTPPHTPPGTTTEEEEEEVEDEDEDNVAFSDMDDPESALDLTPRAESSSGKTRHVVTNNNAPRPLDLPPPFSQTPRSRAISVRMQVVTEELGIKLTSSQQVTVNQGDHLIIKQESLPLPSRDLGGVQEDEDD